MKRKSSQTRKKSSVRKQTDKASKSETSTLLQQKSNRNRPFLMAKLRGLLMSSIRASFTRIFAVSNSTLLDYMITILKIVIPAWIHIRLSCLMPLG
jgi:hypothetical protein